MVSTPAYYQVCRNLIAEVCDLFDKPRLFHLGMDEEEQKHQRHFEYVVLRQYNLWWRDFNFFVEQVEAKGAKAWIWSDYVWEHPDMFYERMPKSILQSNWYYGDKFSPDVKEVKAYLDLEDHKYDQVPTLSNWETPDNIHGTVDFCVKHIPAERLKGFFLAPWRPTLPEVRDTQMAAVEHFGKAVKKLK